jgi:glucokinase
VHGFTGTAGELGHNILIPNGRQCSCGRKGCLEAYTSARGIVQTYVELRQAKGTPAEAINHSDWIGAEWADKDITSKMIGELAHQGDPIALKTWETVADQLGLAMANSVTFSAPEAIFIMGGPAQVGDPLLKPLRAAFERYMLNIYAGSCQIRMSELKANEVAILGAAALIKMPKN